MGPMEMENGATTAMTAAITAVIARGSAGCFAVCMVCFLSGPGPQAGP